LLTFELEPGLPLDSRLMSSRSVLATSSSETSTALTPAYAGVRSNYRLVANGRGPMTLLTPLLLGPNGDALVISTWTPEGWAPRSCLRIAPPGKGP
jgi:hypothetical protein